MGDSPHRPMTELLGHSQVWEFGQVVVVRPDSIGVDGAIGISIIEQTEWVATRHDPQLDVDHVVGQGAAVQRSRSSRRGVVGDDIRQ